MIKINLAHHVEFWRDIDHTTGSIALQFLKEEIGEEKVPQMIDTEGEFVAVFCLGTAVTDDT